MDKYIYIFFISLLTIPMTAFSFFSNGNRSYECESIARIYRSGQSGIELDKKKIDKVIEIGKYNLFNFEHNIEGINFIFLISSQTQASFVKNGEARFFIDYRDTGGSSSTVSFSDLSSLPKDILLYHGGMLTKIDKDVSVAFHLSCIKK